MLSPLFTDGVWNTTFKTDLKDYCDFIRNNDKGRVLSNKGGYQSNDVNIKEPLLQPLIQHIETQTNAYSKLFNCKDNSFKVDNLWININGFKDTNEEHTHTGCMFSGVYYVHTPKDCGDIEFTKLSIHMMATDWADSVTSFNSFNSGRWNVPAIQHTCYIFPSYYIHRVLPNCNKEEERYSLSFNLSSNS